jgi:hypothetical protein
VEAAVKTLGAAMQHPEVLADPVAVRNYLGDWLNFRTSYVTLSKAGFQPLQAATDAGVVPVPQHLERDSETSGWVCSTRTFPIPNSEYYWTFGFWRVEEHGGKNRLSPFMPGNPRCPKMIMEDSPIYARAVFFLAGGPIEDEHGWSVWAADPSLNGLDLNFVESFQSGGTGTDLNRGFFSTETGAAAVVAKSTVDSNHGFSYKFDGWFLPFGAPPPTPPPGSTRLDIPMQTSKYAIAIYSLSGMGEGPENPDEYIINPGIIDIWGPYRRGLQPGAALMELEARVAGLQKQIDALSRRS